MSEAPASRWSKLLVFPPILAGALVLAWMVAGREPPPRVEPVEPAQPVRIIEAPALTVTPQAEGFGPVRPARVWRAVAQVAGRVVEIHPRLRDGEILAAGTLLARIDPADYELAAGEAGAELAELEVRERNADASLAIEARNLELATRELERLRRLAQQGNASQSSVDEAERTMLAITSAAQNLRNTVALIPSQRDVLMAKVARARRDLERTDIHAPFTLRVAHLEIEADQYVAVGQRLFEGDDVERVEIEAQVALSNLRHLFVGSEEVGFDPVLVGARLPEVVGLDPLVRLDIGGAVAEWQATFVRFSDDVDPQTRTMGVVVAVDRPFQKAIPGRRPPLSKGMFVQVLVRGRSGPPRVVVPRHAVRGGALYVADDEDRLRVRSVETLFARDDVVVIESGLEPGERVVVSDLVPAVDGMLLRPQVDEALTARLRSAGRGP